MEREASLLRFESSQAETFSRMDAAFGRLACDPDLAMPTGNPLARRMTALAAQKTSEAAEISSRIPVRLESRGRLAAELQMIADGAMSASNVTELASVGDRGRYSVPSGNLVLVTCGLKASIILCHSLIEFKW